MLNQESMEILFITSSLPLLVINSQSFLDYLLGLATPMQILYSVIFSQNSSVVIINVIVLMSRYLAFKGPNLFSALYLVMEWLMIVLETGVPKYLVIRLSRVELTRDC